MISNVYIMEAYDDRKRLLGVYQDKEDAKSRVDKSINVDFDDGTQDYTHERGVYGKVGRKDGPLYGYWVEKKRFR